MPDPQHLSGSPLDRVRAAVAAPAAVDLASPILARDLAELTRRLALARRRRGEDPPCVDFSPHVGRLVAALDAGASLAGDVH